MPNIGDSVLGQNIGKWRGQRYTWLACIDCGKQRWVIIQKGKYLSGRCISCAVKQHTKPIGSKNPNWQGGRYKSSQGYVYVRVYPNDFFYPMAIKEGYVFEHRLAMAKHLGRCLQPFEKVHHKDGIKDHNEYSNLKMTTAGSHILEHSKGYQDGYQQGLLDGRDRQIQELKKEIKLLQWQFNEFCRSGVK